LYSRFDIVVDSVMTSFYTISARRTNKYPRYTVPVGNSTTKLNILHLQPITSARHVSLIKTACLTHLQSAPLLIRCHLLSTNTGISQLWNVKHRLLL